VVQWDATLSEDSLLDLLVDFVQWEGATEEIPLEGHWVDCWHVEIFWESVANEGLENGDWIQWKMLVLENVFEEIRVGVRTLVVWKASFFEFCCWDEEETQQSDSDLCGSHHWW